MPRIITEDEIQARGVVAPSRAETLDQPARRVIPETEAKRYEPSMDSETGMIQRPTLPLVQGYEKEWAEHSPTMWAFGKTAGGLALDFIPFAKYLATPAGRDEWNHMELEEQQHAFLWELFGLGLLVGGPLAVAKGATTLARSVSRLQTPSALAVPVEDAVRALGGYGVKWGTKQFDYGVAVNVVLKNMKFADEEIPILADVLQGGGERKLIDAVLARKIKGRANTAAFERATDWVAGSPYPAKTLKAEFLQRFSPDRMRANYWLKSFTNAVEKEVLYAKQGPRVVQGVFDAHVKRLWPETAEKVTFENITHEQMSNLIVDMLKVTGYTRGLLQIGAGRTLPVTMLPTRVAFATIEQTWGGISNIYEPVKAAFGAAHKYNFENILAWNKMLEQRGLGEIGFKKTGEFRFKPAKGVDSNVFDRAYNVIRKMDDETGTLLKKGLKGEEFEAAAQQIRSLPNRELSHWDPARKVIDAHREYMDSLYGDFMERKIPQIFSKEKLTLLGQSALDGLMQRITPTIRESFSTAGSRHILDKRKAAREVLSEVKKFLDFEGNFHPYFQASGKELDATLKKLTQAFTIGRSPKNFMSYVDNYAARIAQREAWMVDRWNEKWAKSVAGFTRVRFNPTMQRDPLSFAHLLESRTMAQAKELFLYPTLERVAQYTEGLPPSVVEYTEHFLSRALNRPSISDHKVAGFLSKFGKQWTERDVMRAAQSVNNLTYMGGLGFKPFSAMRNLFQPLLTVPAELGGLKDLGTLVSGMKRALTSKADRDWLRQIGVITEYAPEITLRPKALPFGAKIGGKELPPLEDLRDAAMWMFQKSDRFNRYVTGTAAMTKWEKAVGKFAKPSGRIAGEDLHAFMRAAGAKNREAWVQERIADSVRRGLMEDGKKTFVLDVVADTQYLYGSLEVPRLTRIGGGVGRTAMLFQSWWMNYSNLLEKWVRFGVMEGNIQPIMTAMASAAIAGELMEPLWGEKSAAQMVGFGPLPSEVSEFTVPPSWKPIYYTLRAVRSIQTPEISSQQAAAALKSLSIMVPGGLQLGKQYKGYKEEGWSGFAKAIVGYKGD